MSLKRGPRTRHGFTMTGAQRKAKHDAPKVQERLDDIAVLDFETDPFDNNNPTMRVKPFLCVIHSSQFDTIVIWEEDEREMYRRVVDTILNLPRKFTIYAHNGGKFDYMFFVHLLRGGVFFKGRGIMSANIGPHELRDSFHIIPEKLASYRKDDFDYTMLTKKNRNKHRDVIISYCINDCVYTLEIIAEFIKRHGRKLSIGQAAKAAVVKSGYTIPKLTEGFDLYLRDYYFGGRVECLAGKGQFTSRPGHVYKLYDVNSMYPAAMNDFRHPVGAVKDYVVRTGKPGPNTVFIELECENFGAFVKRGEDGETTATCEQGTFKTTVWEYDAAVELNLIDNVKIKFCVDCTERTTFENFVQPYYSSRIITKKKMQALREAGQENSREFFETKIDDIFAKLFLNNAYGKEATNPRRFKEHYFTNIGERPETEANGFKCCLINQPFKSGVAICRQCGLPSSGYGPRPIYEDEVEGYAIWSKPPERMTFFNVGVAASITGAARAMLMRGIANAVDPIYCDTDSIICADLQKVPIHKSDLGAWDIENSYKDVIIAGKKLYACIDEKDQYKYRMKGSSGATWNDYVKMLHDEALIYTAIGPTMTRTRNYFHTTRTVRATGPMQGNVRLIDRRKVAS